MRKQVYKAAQAEHMEAARTGRLGSGPFTARAIAARATAKLPSFRFPAHNGSGFAADVHEVR